MPVGWAHPVANEASRHTEAVAVFGLQIQMQIQQNISVFQSGRSYTNYRSSAQRGVVDYKCTGKMEKDRDERWDPVVAARKTEYINKSIIRRKNR